MNNTNSTDYYWDQAVNEKIDKYVTSPNVSKSKRDKIYTNHIYPVFDQMIGAIIQKYDFFYTRYENDIDALTSDVQVHLYNVLEDSRRTDKYYDPDEGSSYSYFTTTAKFYLVKMQKEDQKMYRNQVSINDEDVNVELQYSIQPDVGETLKEKKSKKFLDGLEKYLKHNRDELFNDEEQDFLDFFLEAMNGNSHWLQGRQHIRNIREHTDIDLDGDTYKYTRFKNKLNTIKEALESQFKFTGEVNVDQQISYE